MSDQITPVTSVAIREPHYERVGFASLGASGGALAISNMAEAVSVAQLMAKSGIAIRKHLREQPGACLGVLMQAMRWEFDPYMVANKSYAVNDQLAYEAQLLAAVVLTRAAIVDEPDYTYDGEGPTRTCTVAFKMRSGKFLSYTTPQIGNIKTQNSPLWKSDPDQQLGYFAVRSWARRHQPHVLLGVYTVEEAQEVIDVTPGTSGVAARLPGAQEGAGFNREGVEAEAERAAPKAARAGRKPKAPEPVEEAQERPTTVEGPTETDGAQTAGEEQDTSGSAEDASEASQDQTASSQPETEEPTSDGPEDDDADAEGLQGVSEAQDALDAERDLPPDLKVFVKVTETADSWQGIKNGLVALQKSPLWPTLNEEQTNRIRCSTWEAMEERGVDWMPDPTKDMSAFRLWIEACNDPNLVSEKLGKLGAWPDFATKSEDLRARVIGPAQDRIKALLA